MRCTGTTSKKSVIKLSKTKLTLEVGESKTIKLKGAKTTKVRWTTSKKSVATVSKGKIKAKKAGTATITAKYKSKNYKCKVTVLNKETDPDIIEAMRKAMAKIRQHKE